MDYILAHETDLPLFSVSDSYDLQYLCVNMICHFYFIFLFRTLLVYHGQFPLLPAYMRYVFMCLCMCDYACKCASICAYVHRRWRRSSVFFLIVTGLSLNLELTNSARMVDQQVKGLSSPYTPRTENTITCHAWLFTLLLEVQTQAFMLLYFNAQAISSESIILLLIIAYDPFDPLLAHYSGVEHFD